MNVVVYLGSSPGNDPIYKEQIYKLGAMIGDAGHDLVYGGSKIGLMGVIADAVLDHGGHVTGVEPKFFIEECRQHERIDELIVTEDMFERRKTMYDMGDAYIAFPGGIGTLEEITDIMSAVHLRLMDKPYVLYNLNGYFDHFKALLDHMTEQGFIAAGDRANIRFADTLEEVADIIGL